MPLASLGQIALKVSDVDRAEQFYGDRLGLPRLFRAGPLAFFDCAGVRLMLDGSAGPDAAVQPGDACCHYFRVGQIERTAAELRKLGVDFVAEPHCVAKLPDHALWMCFFRDPDGHLLALMEERR